jgi:serine/threonine-protein kinase SRPK3
MEEEGNPGYDSRIFYPARIGEDLHRKYRLLSKLGWGLSSTVWLAKGIQRFELPNWYMLLVLLNNDSSQMALASQPVFCRQDHQLF